MDFKKASDILKTGVDKAKVFIENLPFRNLAEKNIPAETRAKFPILDKAIPFANQIVSALAVVLLVAIISGGGGSGRTATSAAPAGGGAAPTQGPIVIDRVVLGGNNLPHTYMTVYLTNGRSHSQTHGARDNDFTLVRISGTNFVIRRAYRIIGEDFNRYEYVAYTANISNDGRLWQLTSLPGRPRDDFTFR